MPYNSYTNDSDTQFASQLDDYKLGLNRSAGVNDYDAAVAGFNVLPESLAVGQLMAMRGNASRDAMATRRAVAEDRAKFQEEEEYKGFSSFISGMSGKSNEEVADSINQRMLQNPNEMVNPLVREAMQAFGAVDSLRTNIGQNRVSRAKQESESKDIAFNEQNRAKNEAAANLARDAQIVGSEVSIRKSREAMEAMDKGDAMQANGILYGTGVFGPEELAQREQYSAVLSHFQKNSSNDPLAAKAMRQFGRIGSGLTYASEIPKLLKLDVDQSMPDIELLRSKGINLGELGKDAEADKVIIDNVKELANATGGAQGTGMMRALKSVSEYNGAIKQSSEQKKVFFERLGRLNSLLADPATAGGYEATGLIADMTAMGDQILGHYETKLGTTLQRQKLAQNEIKLQGSIQRIKNEADRVEVSKRGLWLREKYIQLAEERGIRNDYQSMLKFVADLDKNVKLERIDGLREDSSYQDAAKFLMEDSYSDDGTGPEF